MATEPTTNRASAATQPRWLGAWAKALRARKFHYFVDRSARCLCGAYATDQVSPSRFGTGQPDDERCPTCERKLGYLIRGEHGD